MSTVITGYRNSSGVARIKLPAGLELNKEEKKQVSTAAPSLAEQRTAVRPMNSCQTVARQQHIQTWYITRTKKLLLHTEYLLEPSQDFQYKTVF